MSFAQRQVYKDPRRSPGIKITISVENNEYGFEDTNDSWQNVQRQSNFTPIKTKINSSHFPKSDVRHDNRKHVQFINNPLSDSPKMNNFYMHRENHNYDSEEYNPPITPNRQHTRAYNNRRNNFQQNYDQNQKIYSSHFDPNLNEVYIPKSKRIQLDDDFYENNYQVSNNQSPSNSNNNNKYRNRQDINDSFSSTSSNDEDEFKRFEQYFKSKNTTNENVIINNRFNKKNTVNINDDNNNKNRYRKQFAKPRNNNILEPNQNTSFSSSTSSSDDSIIHNNIRSDCTIKKRTTNKEIENDSYFKCEPVKRVYIDDEENEENHFQHIRFSHPNYNQQFNNRKK